MKKSSDKLRTLNLLIIDDNPGDRLLYRQMLENVDPGTDYRVVEAETADSARQKFQQGRFDCVLLDYLLPDLHGLDLLRHMKEQAPDGPPVVMLTGFGDEATAVNAIKAGAQGYIPKRDLDGKILLAAIDQAIKAHHKSLQLDKDRAEMDARNRELERKCKDAQGIYRNVMNKLAQPTGSIRDRIRTLVDGMQQLSQAEVRSGLLQVQAEAERLLASLRNLEHDPSMSVSRLLISTHPQSLTEIVSETVRSLRPAADSANVRLAVRLQPGLPEVPLDRYRIEQVLFNLVDNAIRSTAPRGTVSLIVGEAADKPRFVRIMVQDTGCGTPEQPRNDLFDQPDPLPEGHQAANPQGLGWPICREIVRLHDGSIEVDSTPGKGTCVSVALPMLTRGAPAAQVWERTVPRHEQSAWSLSA